MVLVVADASMASSIYFEVGRQSSRGTVGAAIEFQLGFRVESVWEWEKGMREEAMAHTF